MRRQRGFTLIEMLIVVVMLGILTALALPRIQAGALQQSLRGSRNTLAGLYTQARMTAMQQGRNGQLRFNGNTVLVTAEPGTGGNAYDTIIKPRDLNDEFGVTVTPEQSVISISPKGILAIAGNEVAIKVAKHDSTVGVVITRYGRLSK